MSKVVATAGAVYSCDTKYGLSHGDGPLVFGAEPVRLDAVDDVTVAVPGVFDVELSWDGPDFVDNGDGTYTAPAPLSGCNRLRLDISDPGTDHRGDFAVMVAVDGADCTPTPPIQGFQTLGKTPNEITINVVDVDVVIDVANPPDGFFCPTATYLSGVELAITDFILGCTASGNGNAILQLQGLTPGTSVIEITARTATGTPADSSTQATITITN